MAILASASLASAGVYGASETRAADVLPEGASTFMGGGDAGGAGQCRVDVVRSGQSGVANVTRAVSNGQCVCTVTTGPASGNGPAEEVVNALLRDRTCDGAPAAGDTGQTAGGGGGGVLGGVVGAVAAGGLAVGLGGKSKG